MLEFIQLLKQRYQSALAQLDKNSRRGAEYAQRIEELLYAEAFGRKIALLDECKRFPLQIAVIGPTQAGKSTLVNVLLNGDVAGVSPLAGYTAHAQGFCHGLNVADCDGLQGYFGRFERLPLQALNRYRFDCYALGDSVTTSPLLPACVVWDTPDFDSIDAADYREGLVRTIALADAVVLVVSKEKYADQSVWDIMQTIEGLGQPTLICLNKLAADSESLVVDSLRQKWLQHRKDPVPTVVPLLFQKHPAQPVWPANGQQALFQLLKQVERKKQAQFQQQFIKRHWQQWLAPVEAEWQAQREWQTLVDQCLAQAVENYRRDYLDHPHHYQTFQAALLNLLTLLEIPGLAKALSKARRAMTWPIRKLMRLGAGSQTAHTSQEAAILGQAAEHALIQLAEKLLEKAEQQTDHAAWWRETAALLRQQRPLLAQQLGTAANGYQEQFKQEVEAAAYKLYYKLQEQPLVLNSLRATRVSTDAGAMLLAIQLGGIGVHDLVITPLILSMTSLLAESAIGGYMQRVEAELKQRQLHVVQTMLFDRQLRDTLYPLAQLSQAEHRFNLSEQQYRQAELALQQKKHGLRIL